MNRITRKAYAKINLGLDVLKRRPDGYHEVKMIMQTINLYDELIFEKNSSVACPPITIICDSGAVPVGEENIIYRAATRIYERYRLKQAVTITLKKVIPVAAGMAGGSADAAAVFHGLNDLFDLGISIPEMCKMATEIGADIPFCIISGTAFSEGIGEKLTPLPPAPPCGILIAKPDIHVSTQWVYENLCVNDIARHPDIDGMVTAIHKQDLTGIITRMENVLETVTIGKYPRIDEIKVKMLSHGAESALMSGSGPTVFGIFTNEKKAQAAYHKMKEEYEAYLTSFYQPQKWLGDVNNQ